LIDMTTEVRKPLPDRQDIDNGPFWEGTDKGELRVKRCGDCGRCHWPPRLGCPYCGSGELAWVAVSPKGEVFSWTIVHRSQTPGFETATPYAVVLVELSEAKGVRMIGNLVNCAPDKLKAGLVVEAVFTPSVDGSVKLVNWQPAAGAQS
jgi:uncharacterized OB-fold protein